MSKTKILPLTPQEESVMKMIWELGNGITVRQVLEKLPSPRPPYTTLASIIKNLQAKEYIHPEKKGKTLLYHISISEERYSASSLQHIVRTFFGGDYRRVVQFFASKESLSSQDLQEIIDLIEKEK
ncbi:MAG: BlaI/MecI/CopY family transcriptional regulator [Bacteroidales bacterium]|nr:BlaI/MecI/CopY family transcriptional regulator [Bacteroidales bacterium]